ncbi:MAG: hypothetical protein EP330_06820 [Deltaproteobacteria bacterium]|nr:MAG: hypothetical protein EP330_06820 [Deltaproteobacteria bacterium]
MSEDDVWAAEAASAEEDFGPCEFDAERAAKAVKVDHFMLWGLKLFQNAPIPLILGGLALWFVGLIAGVLAQFANLGGSLAGSLSGDPMMQQALSTLAQSVAQLAAAPFLWIATAAIITAAARAVVFDDTEWKAVMPSASSILAVFVSQIALFVAIQIPLSLVLGGAGALGYAAAGNVFEEQILYAAGAVIAVFALLAIPLIYLGLRLKYVLPAAVIEGDGIAAIRASWKLTSDFGVLGHTFLFLLVEIGLGLVNVALCCFLGLPSVIITPFVQGGMTAVYLRATRPDAVLASSGFYDEPVEA